MDKIKWIIFTVVVAAIFGSVIIINKSNVKTFKGDAAQVITEGPIGDHVTGSPAHKVLLIEYGDFQCPGCGKMYQPVKDFTTLYKDKLTFVFRNMPLTNIHANALAAATAVEAAGLQGKYYELHDVLYENQSAWSEVGIGQRAATFEGYANQLGLDMTKFKKDIDSQDIKNKIARDRSTGIGTFKIDQTPSFILNGKLLEAKVATDPAKLKQAVEDALKKAYPDFTPATAAPTPQ